MKKAQSKEEHKGRVTDGYRRHQIHKSEDRDPELPQGV